MRRSYSRAAARRESTDQFNARMAARTAPVKPWGKILSAEEVAQAKTNERDAFNPDEFSEAEQLAILNMSPSIRHQAVWHHLRRDFDVPPFTLSTFIALAERGLARKPDGKTFHTLTNTALPYAEAIADHLVGTRDVHAPWLGGRTKATITLHCTCKYSCAIRLGGHTQDNALRAHREHLRKVGVKVES